jgi:flagellar hook-associated protein 2
MSSSSSGLPPTIAFNGSSTYASSFQNVLNRAVDLASLPMQITENDLSKLQSKQSALTSLGSTFTSLQTAIANVSTAAGGTPLAFSSTPAAVSATATSTALPGTYTIQVDNLGSTTTTMSMAGLTTVSDPSSASISTSGAFSLTVNGTSFNINPSGNTLNDLVSAINTANDGVQATMVNVGSTASPDYRLALSGNNLASDTIQLNDGSQNLLDTLSTGANAQYRVNGQATEINSTSSQITLSPGLTVHLAQQTTAPVTITVSQSSSGLQSALSNLATAYNAAVAAVGQHRGVSGGALTGDSLIYELTGALNKMVTYTGGSGSVTSLASLGLNLSQTGTLTFDATAFASANLAGVQSFLGNVSTGGLLQSASTALHSFTDSTKGLIANEYNIFSTQITSDNNQIREDQARLTTLQTSLLRQLAAADAAIASLQSQNNYFAQLFTATYGSSSSPTH